MKQLLAAVLAAAELCNSTAKLHSKICPVHMRIPSSSCPVPLHRSSPWAQCLSHHFPCALCPAHRKVEQALSAPASPRRARLCFLLSLSASTGCTSYKSTRKHSALHRSLVHNYYFIAFLRTKLFSRMWLESALEVRPYQSCNWQDWTCP